MKRLERIRLLGHSTSLLSVCSLALLMLFPLVAPGAPAPEDAVDRVRGAKVWSDNCLRCHRMRDPKDYRDDQWDPVIYHMRIRAGLTGQETRDILEFLKSSN